MGANRNFNLPEENKYMTWLMRTKTKNISQFLKSGIALCPSVGHIQYSRLHGSFIYLFHIIWRVTTEKEHTIYNIEFIAYLSLDTIIDMSYLYYKVVLA